MAGCRTPSRTTAGDTSRVRNESDAYGAAQRSVGARGDTPGWQDV